MAETNLRIILWLVLFVATCIAGMVTMATLNHHPGVINIRTTTAVPTPIYNTSSLSTQNYADDNCNRVSKDFITIREGWWAKNFQFSFDH